MKFIQQRIHLGKLALESGVGLPVDVTYHTFGEYIPNQTKVIWVCHALTANSDVSDWWSGLFGEGKLFDRSDIFVICANVLGSCYGTTSPTSKQIPVEFRAANFPRITIKDMVIVLEKLRQKLNISHIDFLIGASIGGQQALEWAIDLKENLKELLLIATNAFHSPFGIAFNEAQRLALEADSSLWKKSKTAGRNGLIAARSIAMLSYRSFQGYLLTQKEETAELPEKYRASSYQRYQGEKLANRFHAQNYWYLLHAMDSHHVGRNRNSTEEALNQISAQTTVIGISSDLLFPTSEQRFLVQYIPNAFYHEIDSDFGHDGFLVETQLLTEIIKTNLPFFK